MCNAQSILNDDKFKTDFAETPKTVTLQKILIETFDQSDEDTCHDQPKDKNVIKRKHPKRVMTCNGRTFNHFFD